MDPQLVRGAIARARATDQSSWVSSGEIRRPGAAAAVIDPDTGDMTAAASTLIYSGPCALIEDDGRSQRPQRDDTALTEHRQVLKVPGDAGPFQVGDVFTLTEVHDDVDERIAGRSWRVVGVPERSYLVSQRLEVTEVLTDG